MRGETQAPNSKHDWPSKTKTKWDISTHNTLIEDVRRHKHAWLRRLSFSRLPAGRGILTDVVETPRRQSLGEVCDEEEDGEEGQGDVAIVQAVGLIVCAIVTDAHEYLRKG